jgi:hypothetical protein
MDESSEQYEDSTGQRKKPQTRRSGWSGDVAARIDFVELFIEEF